MVDPIGSEVHDGPRPFHEHLRLEFAISFLDGG